MKAWWDPLTQKFGGSHLFLAIFHQMWELFPNPWDFGALEKGGNQSIPGHHIIASGALGPRAPKA